MVIRPIVSSVDSPTYYWAVFIHLGLWQSVVGHPSTLVTSADLLKELADVHWSRDLTFLTLDVKSLYTSIEHKHGLDALNEFLAAKDHPIRSTLVALMELVLENKYFYHQLRGTARGSPAAVTYACIFMFAVESNHLSRLIASSIVFKRYIDDLFAILPTSELDPCIAEPIITGCSVQFTNERSASEVVILDLKLRISNSAITSRLNFKTTNKFAYISPRSNQPRHTWSADATGELIRAARRATNAVLANGTKAFLRLKLQQRGYNRRVIERALGAERRRRPPSGKHPSPLVLKYHPSLAPIAKLLPKFWKMSGLSPDFPCPLLAWAKHPPPHSCVLPA